MKNGKKGVTPLEKATDEAESGSAVTRDGMTTTSLSCWLVQHPSDLFGIVRKDSRQAGMTEGGFTLIELIIAMTVILIVSLGFFGWASTIIQTNLSIERNNTAYAMAMDVADRLQRMSDNSLIRHTTASKRYVGFTTDGDLRKCAAGVITGNPVASDVTGKTEYTNPTQSSTTPYLFDNNACEGSTWVTTACRTGSTIATASNTNIDHPSSNLGTPNYDSINPIRSYKNTTYYAVWSVAYMPCNAGTNTDRRKIFVTVYWIDPEPGATIASGATVKSVSVVVDKTIGTEG